MLWSTAPFARPRLSAENLAHIEDRQQLSLAWLSQLAFAVSSYSLRSVGQGIGLPLRRSLQSPRGLTLLRKARTVPALWAYPGTSSTPLHRSDLDSGQLFVETVVLTSLVTVAGLRVSASPAVSGLTVVGHRSTLELEQAPVRIQQTTASSYLWDKVPLAQLIVPRVRLGLHASSSCHRSFGTLGTLLHKTA